MPIENRTRDGGGKLPVSDHVSTNEGERKKALDAVLANLEKAFGKGAVMRLGEQKVSEIRAIATGAIGLDIAIGIGGFPRGRVVEIYGPESSGKTTLALSVIAECQRVGGTAAFVDAEHALDPEYARKIGVDVDSLLVSQPDNGEQAMEITEQLVRSGAVDLVVVDSVAALVPKAEIEGEMGDIHMGLQARLMSQALRKLTGCISKSQTCVTFINQLREKIGVMFGSPETTPGGRALKFYASVRLDIRRIEAIKVGNENIGNRVRVRAVKNKVAPPFRESEFEILFGEGIDRAGNILDVAEEHRIIEKSGTFYSYGDLRLGQGRERARTFLKENPKLVAEIDLKVRLKTKMVPEDKPVAAVGATVPSVEKQPAKPPAAVTPEAKPAAAPPVLSTAGIAVLGKPASSAPAPVNGKPATPEAAVRELVGAGAKK